MKFKELLIGVIVIWLIVAMLLFMRKASEKSDVILQNAKHLDRVAMTNAILSNTMRYNPFTGQLEIKDGTNWVLYKKL